MGGRRAALKGVEWVAFAERVPPNQRTMFNNLKTRNSPLPEKPAPIDWGHYRAAVAKAGMVNEFKTKFNALKVPEPVDTQTELIDAQEAEALDKFRNMIPFDQMTIEDLNETSPETKLGKKKHPYWPHKPITDL